MLRDLLNTVIGLVVGLLSGFFFERRATRSARAHAEELEQELSELRHSILSVGGSLPERRDRDVVPKGDLIAQVRQRALSVQNSEGRVSRSALTTYMLAQGHSAVEVDEAIHVWCVSGEAEEDGKWLILK